ATASRKPRWPGSSRMRVDTRPGNISPPVISRAQLAQQREAKAGVLEVEASRAAHGAIGDVELGQPLVPGDRGAAIPAARFDRGAHLLVEVDLLAEPALAARQLLGRLVGMAPVADQALGEADE